MAARPTSPGDDQNPVKAAVIGVRQFGANVANAGRSARDAVAAAVNGTTASMSQAASEFRRAGSDDTWIAFNGEFVRRGGLLTIFGGAIAVLVTFAGQVLMMVLALAGGWVLYLLCAVGEALMGARTAAVQGRAKRFLARKNGVAQPTTGVPVHGYLLDVVKRETGQLDVVFARAFQEAGRLSVFACRMAAIHAALMAVAFVVALVCGRASLSRGRAGVQRATLFRACTVVPALSLAVAVAVFGAP